MRLIISIIIVLGATVASAQGRLEVTVMNFRNVEGSVRVGLFENSRDFLKTPLYGKVAPVMQDSVTVVFENLPPGTYAISAIHDRNSNGELDTNMFGIPKEGFAFGNNSMGMFGPPSFEKASVTIGDAPVAQALRLKYF